MVGGVKSNWHISHGQHEKSHKLNRDLVRGAYFYTANANRNWALQQYDTAHRWSTKYDQGGGDTFCTKPPRAKSFKKGVHTLVRVKVTGSMTSPNIKKSCNRRGMKPVCDNNNYFDGNCVMAGGKWHFSHPSHDKKHKVPLSTVMNTYWYTNNRNKKSLWNRGDTHVWKPDARKDSNGYTFCTKAPKKVGGTVLVSMTKRRFTKRRGTNSFTRRVALTKQGSSYIETKEIFRRPIDVSVQMRLARGSNECGVMAVFPQNGNRHSGYNAGVGWWRNYFGAGVDGRIGKRGNNAGNNLRSWHTVRINVASNGKVYFYVNGQLRYQIRDTRYRSGRIRFGNGCRDFQWKNLRVSGKNVLVPGAMKIAMSARKWNSRGNFRRRRLVVIGSARGTKTVNVPAGYSCPTVVTKRNWAMGRLPHWNCNDAFRVSVSGTKVIARRTDSRGRNGGWGMSLRFYCTQTVTKASFAGRVATVRQGSAYIETKQVFKRPLDVTASIRQSSGGNECGVLSVFPRNSARHSGYNAGVGWWRNYFGAGADGSIGKRGGNAGNNLRAWHKIRINVAADGKVYFYVNGQLRHTVVNNRYRSGRIRFGNNCRDFQIKDVNVCTGLNGCLDKVGAPRYELKPIAHVRGSSKGTKSARMARPLYGNAKRSIYAQVKTRKRGNYAVVSTGSARPKQAFNLVSYGSRGRCMGVMGYGYDYYPKKCRIAVNDGKWHEVAVVYDGKKLKLYTDGELQNTATKGKYNTRGSGVSVGMSNHRAHRRYFVGKIAGVRITSTAKYVGDFEVVIPKVRSPTVSSVALVDVSFCQHSLLTPSFCLFPPFVCLCLCLFCLNLPG